MGKHGQLDCCGGKSHRSALKIVLLVGLCGLLVAAVLQARAQDTAADATQAPVHGRIARLSYVDGTVTVTDPDGASPDQAVANMPATEGTQIDTGSDGHAEVTLEDGSVARIAPNSSLQVSRLAGGAPSGYDTALELRSGEGYFEPNPAAGAKFTVEALGLHISADEPAAFRVSWLAQPEQVAVSVGWVKVTHASDYSVRVNANETLSVDDADVTRYLLSSGTDGGPNDAWNAERDELLAQAGERATEADANPENADLDLYGNFYDVPGVGQVWQPYGYAESWTPFDDGYWGWYPWGYTWISAYPWGWLPYHCGYWNYFNGLGWGWVNSGCGIGAGWYPVDVWYGPAGWNGPRKPVWHPHRPVHRIIPVGGVKEHPFQPQPAHRVPSGFKPRPVSVGGKIATPLPMVPAVGRAAFAPRLGARPEPLRGDPGFGTAGRAAPGQTIYGSRANNPESARGAGSIHPSAPASGRGSAPPPPPAHSSPPPASSSHSDNSSHK